MPINISDPDYIKAEKAFYEAADAQEQLIALNQMISYMPGHKGAENLRQQLTTRRKKLELQVEKKKKAGKSSRTTIRKEDMQGIIVGKTNSGKSSLLQLLTNAEPRISENKFTTVEPQVGILEYAQTQIQMIEIPAIDGEYFDKGLVHTADTVMVLVNNFEEIEEVVPKINTLGKIIVVYNKIDLLNENEKRKLKAKLQSKKINFVLISVWENLGIEDLKKKLYESFGRIRVHTKEPGQEKSDRPIVLKPGATVKDVAEKILKGFSKKVKTVKLWGPSSKFGGQIISLRHVLKDRDVIEFRTK